MKRVINLIVMDESGSMSIIENAARSGLNETLDTVKKMQEKYPDMEQRVTLILFDSSHKHFVFDNAKVDETHQLSRNEYNPGGATPLYDAIGLGISKVNALAQEDDKVLVTIITDGLENCSTEYDLKMVKTLIEKLKKQGWTFSLIGTDNLDVEGMANSMAIDNHLAFAENEEDTKAMFADEREARMAFAYCCYSDASMAPGSYFDNVKNKRRKNDKEK